MRPRAGRSVLVSTIQGQLCVCVSLARVGVQLTPDGEVALLGLVHHYLATWAARAAAGEVANPAGGFTYGWDGNSTVEIPVLEADAPAVLATVRSILSRTVATSPASPSAHGRHLRSA